MKVEIVPFQETVMDVELMRLAWSVVDETPLPRRQNLSFRDRITAVLHEIENKATLSPHERQQIQQYLVERQHLIAELYQ